MAYRLRPLAPPIYELASGFLPTPLASETGHRRGAVFAGRNSIIYGCRWPGEPELVRVADGAPNRVDRLRCLGNAVVPQIPELIGRAILEAEAA
jgi:hypothetical protein